MGGNLKAVIFYSSDYRTNTEKIAEIMASEMGADYVNVGNFKNDNYSVEQYDLIGFGSGVYREDLSNDLYKLTERLMLKEKKVFVFSTSGIGMSFYNKRLLRHLTSKGAMSLGSFACKGSFTVSDFSEVKIFKLLGKSAEGHPDEKDLSNAKAFILKIMDSMKKENNTI